MVKLSKSTILMERKLVDGGYVWFYVPDQNRKILFTFDMSMPEQDFLAMGSPQEITVTIEPGDKLNNEFADDRPIDVQSNFELLAEAYLILCDSPKNNVSPEELPRSTRGYLNEDWSKDAGRALRRFAARNKRPKEYIWQDERFNDFPWLT